MSVADPVWRAPRRLDVGLARWLGRLCLAVPLVALAWLAAAAAVEGRAAGASAAVWPTVALALLAGALAVPVALGAALAVEAAPAGPTTAAVGRALGGIGLLPSPVLALPALLVFGRGAPGLGPVFTALAVGALPPALRAARAAVAEAAASRGEVGLALGATPGRTLATLVLPVAAPAVVAGALRGGSRALGLCAPLIVLAVDAPLLPLALLAGGPAERAAAALALVVAALGMEAGAVALGRRPR